MRNGHPYQAYYCEENIWQLALRLGDPSGQVVLLANSEGAFPMWGQRACDDPTLPVVWDYHVVYLRPLSHGWSVLDHDSVLPFPCTLDDWLATSFPSLSRALPLPAPSCRVMPAWWYLSRFSSDRGHMRDDAGHWRAPPPLWPPLLQGGPNLSLLRDPDFSGMGRVVSLEHLKGHLRRCRSLFSLS